MKIKILASGEIKHVENSLGNAFVSAGLAEVVQKPGQNLIDRVREDLNEKIAASAKPAPDPKWEVITHDGRGGKRTVVIRMTRPGFVGEYFGTPEAANAYRAWFGPDGKTEAGRLYLNGFGCAVPDEILSEYKRIYKSKPELRGEAPPFSGKPNEHVGNKQMAEELAFRNHMVKAGEGVPNPNDKDRAPRVLPLD